MKPLIIACVVCMMAAACSNSKEDTKNLVATTDTTSFYPLASFIKDQVKYFDSTGVKFSVVTTEGAIKDSITSQLASIMPMIQSFIEADISDSVQKINYKESVFRDAGTASLNINYTPINTSVPIRNIDILMDDQTSIIKRLFIRKQFRTKDTTSTEQLSWKTNEGFTTSISKEASNGFLRNKTITVRVILP
ncbi:MAG: hypothetical protein NTW77_00695 [Bacteroidetes bacterium]|nr:hypothetical protein [Bacteroidota bacterium]